MHIYLKNNPAKFSSRSDLKQGRLGLFWRDHPNKKHKNNNISSDDHVITRDHDDHWPVLDQCLIHNSGASIPLKSTTQPSPLPSFPLFPLPLPFPFLPFPSIPLEVGPLKSS